MMCEFRNRMARITGYIIDGEYISLLDEKETNLCSVLYYTFVAVFLSLTIGWFVIPLRWICAPLKKIKFVCKKSDGDK